jgi:NTP pyrophosphatase (non-canonical NTP hydrolase)
MNISELVDKILQFQHEKEFPTSVSLDDAEYIMFRNSLLMEEVSELFSAIYRKDKIEIADGLADVLYIVLGTCGILDIPIEEVLEEVHRSNLTKDKGAVKGEGYEKPDIGRILEEHNKVPSNAKVHSSN